MTQADTIRDRYTFAVLCGDEINVLLRVGNQSFQVNPVPCDTRDEAEWFRTMLARAIAEIIFQMNTTKPTESNEQRNIKSN